MKKSLKIGDTFWYYIHPDSLVDPDDTGVFEGEVNKIKTTEIQTEDDENTLQYSRSVEYETYLGLEDYWVDEEDAYETKELALLALNAKLTKQMISLRERKEKLDSYYDRNCKFLEDLQKAKECEV